MGCSVEEEMVSPLLSVCFIRIWEGTVITMLRYYLRIFLEGSRKISKVKVCDDGTNNVRINHGDYIMHQKVLLLQFWNRRFELKRTQFKFKIHIYLQIQFQIQFHNTHNTPTSLIFFVCQLWASQI